MRLASSSSKRSPQLVVGLGRSANNSSPLQQAALASLRSHQEALGAVLSEPHSSSPRLLVPLANQCNPPRVVLEAPPRQLLDRLPSAASLPLRRIHLVGVARARSGNLNPLGLAPRLRGALAPLHPRAEADLVHSVSRINSSSSPSNKRRARSASRCSPSRASARLVKAVCLHNRIRYSARC